MSQPQPDPNTAQYPNDEQQYQFSQLQQLQLLDMYPQRMFITPSPTSNNSAPHPFDYDANHANQMLLENIQTALQQNQYELQCLQLEREKLEAASRYRDRQLQRLADQQSEVERKLEQAAQHQQHCDALEAELRVRESKVRDMEAESKQRNEAINAIMQLAHVRQAQLDEQEQLSELEVRRLTQVSIEMEQSRIQLATDTSRLLDDTQSVQRLRQRVEEEKRQHEIAVKDFERYQKQIKLDRADLKKQKLAIQREMNKLDDMAIQQMAQHQRVAVSTSSVATQTVETSIIVWSEQHPFTNLLSCVERSTYQIQCLSPMLVRQELMPTLQIPKLGSMGAFICDLSKPLEVEREMRDRLSWLKKECARYLPKKKIRAIPSASWLAGAKQRLVAPIHVDEQQIMLSNSVETIVSYLTRFLGAYVHGWNEIKSWLVSCSSVPELQHLGHTFVPAVDQHTVSLASMSLMSTESLQHVACWLVNSEMDSSLADRHIGRNTGVFMHKILEDPTMRWTCLPSMRGMMNDTNNILSILRTKLEATVLLEEVNQQQKISSAALKTHPSSSSSQPQPRKIPQEDANISSDDRAGCVDTVTGGHRVLGFDSTR